MIGVVGILIDNDIIGDNINDNHNAKNNICNNNDNKCSRIMLIISNQYNKTHDDIYFKSSDQGDYDNNNKFNDSKIDTVTAVIMIIILLSLLLFTPPFLL